MIKICDIFGVTRYVVPRPDQMQYESNKLQNDIYENLKFLKEAERSISEFMEYRAGQVKIKIKFLG
jgi:hypothetical protein